MKQYKLGIILFVFVCALIPLSVAAQSPSGLAGGIGLNDVLEVTVNPEYPRAFQDVNISVRSYNSDFDRANITWYVDGTPVLKGTGKTSLDFSVGAVGNTTTVRMEASTTNGSFVVRTFSFRPGDVDLIWEAQTYTPPFYKGKRLHSTGADIKVVALPTLRETNGALVSPQNLVYEWKLGSKVLADQSGFGKQSITLGKESTFRSNTLLHVVVSTLDGLSSAKGTIRITPTSPLVLLYEESPVLGTMFSKALTSSQDLSLTQDEIAIHAIPYFFSTRSAASAQLEYTWYLNGKKLSEPQVPNELILRQTGGTGNARIQVRTQHTDHILQGSQSAVNITYSKEGGSSNSIF